MLERQERLAVLILVVVMVFCGIAAFTLETIGKGPFSNRYDPALPDGTLVSFEGIVQKITPVSQGSAWILDIGGVTVFISTSSALVLPVQGDKVHLYGVMQTWKGKREILVSDGRDIRVIAQSQGKNLRS